MGARKYHEGNFPARTQSEEKALASGEGRGKIMDMEIRTPFLFTVLKNLPVQIVPTIFFNHIFTIKVIPIRMIN